jgi:hypothetical protein
MTFLSYKTSSNEEKESESTKAILNGVRKTVNEPIEMKKKQKNIFVPWF